MKRKIHTIGPKRRTGGYLGACAMLAVVGAALSPLVINTVGLDKQSAEAEVINPEHFWKLRKLFSKDSLLEFDKNKNLRIEVRIVEGPHAGEVAVAHYSSLQKWAGTKFDGVGEIQKGSRVNIEYTQRRLTDNLRVSRIEAKPQ